MKTQNPNISFDKEFLSELAKMESLASPGSKVTFTANNGKLVVVFYGEEVQSRKIFDIPDKSEFSFTLKSSDFIGVIKSFGDGQIAVEDGHIVVKSGRAKLARQTENDPVPPVFPSFEEHTMQELPSSVFPIASYLSYATDNKGTRPALERVDIMLRSGEASIFASDGFRLAMATVPLSYEDEDAEFLLQPRLLQHLAELSKGEDAPVIKIAKAHRHYLLLIGDIQVSTLQLEDKSFREQAEISINRAINADGLSLTIETNAMKQYLNRTKLVASNVLNAPLSLRVDSTSSEFYANYKTSIGSIEDFIPVEVEDTRSSPDNIMRIGFNPTYLSAACSKVFGPKFTLKITGTLNPTVIMEDREDVKYTHLVLPVLLREEKAPVQAAAVVAAAVTSVVAVGVSAEDFI